MQLETEEQVLAYLAEVFPMPREVSLYPGEFCWVFQEVLTREETAAGLGFGRENRVVDKRTGVITAHPSLHPITIGERYDEQVRETGAAQGFQVYPPQWAIEVERITQQPDEVRYRVRGRSLLDAPAGPPVEHLLTIDPRTHHYRTDTETIHDICTHAVTWAFELERTTGQWPPAANFRI
ncbi:hypothetical protein [Nocardia vaccinii]|uniref:hypothetical protein n=1 Tax=Nocardia vaccinii TaxID=1822 RepID=UPI0008343EF7|nr:hypothetical protein [Nocardia vaccinii]